LNITREGALAAVLGGALLGSVVPVLAAEWHFVAEPAAIYDDNVTHGDDSSDIRDDEIAVASVSSGRVFAITGADLITATAELKSAQYLRFGRLGYFDLGPAVSYRHKFGLGVLAPWLALSASVQRRDFYRSRMRDGYAGMVQVAAGRRLSERLDAGLGAAYDWRISKSGTPLDEGLPSTVFNLKGLNLFAKAAYQLTDRVQIDARLNVRRGDVESGTRSEDLAYGGVRAIAPDPAFDDDFYAYRLLGTTVATVAELSWAAGDRSSFSLSGSRDRTFSSGGSSYDGGWLRVSYQYRY